MCGITGFIDSKNRCIEDLNNILKVMAEKLHHRGPDATGHQCFAYEHFVVGFGHKRLSILDLSKAGNQPMTSSNKRFTIIFNGEIYNFKILRRELGSFGCKFIGFSDTEVLVNALEIWGIKVTLSKISGMFAFAALDHKYHKLYLVRDRMGEKPLYYGWQNGNFLFGSELKSIIAYPEFTKSIDKKALCAFLKYRHVPSPLCIYEGFQKLQPGSVLELNLSKINCNKTDLKSQESVWQYWSLNNEVLNTQHTVNHESVSEQLEIMLKNAVSEQMTADVSVGAFLSGGIDSSLIVSMMQETQNKQVETYTVGFKESSHDEAVFAKKVAKVLGTNHNEIYINGQDALDIIPALPNIYDEPFADESQIPTFLITQFASKHVKVVLSGDGGDELFGGYPQYHASKRWWELSRNFPGRNYISIFCSLFSLPWFEQIYKYIPFPNLNLRLRQIERAKYLFGLKDPIDFFDRVTRSQRLYSEKLLKNPPLYQELFQYENKFYDFADDLLTRFCLFDATSFLPDDILVKVDRASMANSLETRIPFLNPDIVTFALSLPGNFKFYNGQSKWPLRKLLYKRLPKNLIERPKQGFSPPINEWLRGPLKKWAVDLLNSDTIKNQGFFKPEPIEFMLKQHLTKKENLGRLLWDLLMFQAWFNNIQ